MPPEARELTVTMEESRAQIAGSSAPSDPPSQIILGGMFGDGGEWYSGFLMLDTATETASIPHAAFYEQDLRQALLELTDAGRDPPESFAFAYQAWEQGEREWPSLHDSQLAIPLATRISDALRSVPDLVQTFRGDPPPGEH
jgi:hypothetical protein